MTISLGSILIVLLIVLVILAIISIATRGAEGRLFPPPAALSVLWSVLLIALLVVLVLWLMRQVP